MTALLTFLNSLTMPGAVALSGLSIALAILLTS